MTVETERHLKALVAALKSTQAELRRAGDYLGHIHADLQEMNRGRRQFAGAVLDVLGAAKGGTDGEDPS